MDNKDMPAMPLSREDSIKYLQGDCVLSGLTKREHFAGLAMQSVLNNFNPYEQGDFDSSDYRLTVQHSVGLADALLAALDKVK
jgi:hypothetical protein